MSFDLDEGIEPQKEKPKVKATVSDGTTNKTVNVSDESKPVKESAFNINTIKGKWMEHNELKEKKVMLLYGEDGTGKSGIALDSLTDEDIKAGKRMMVIDLDGGNVPLIISQHKERCEALGRDVQDCYLVKNPIVMDGEDGNIDYKATFNNIKEAVYLAKHAWEELNLSAIVYDGLSMALKYAEYQMRLERHIADDGGVQTRYWLVRNKIFKEILDQIKSLPISSFFIAHEDFVLKQLEDNSKIKEKTNAMMHQKLHCTRENRKKDNKTIFKATVHKSKYNPRIEGKEFVFLEVDTENEEASWDTSEIYEKVR